MIKHVGNFSKGLVVENELSDELYPSGAVTAVNGFSFAADGARAGGLVGNMKYTAKNTLPVGAGVPVSHYHWSSEKPSTKDIVTLIMKSHNVLLSSEYIGSSWTTSGTGTISQFTEASGFNVVRLSNVTSGFKIQQTITDADVIAKFISGKNGITGAITAYIHGTSGIGVRIFITQNNGDLAGTTYADIESELTATREMHYTDIANDCTSLTVGIEVTDSISGTTYIYIQQPQLEFQYFTLVAPTPYPYGATWDIPCPYTIWQSPLCASSQWYDGIWQNLTEVRTCKVKTVTSQKSIILEDNFGGLLRDLESNIYGDAVSDRWNNYIAKKRSNGYTKYIVDSSYSGVNHTIVGIGESFSVNDEIMLMRSWLTHDANGDVPSPSQLYCDDADISFNSVFDRLYITFGSACRPCIVSYVQPTNSDGDTIFPSADHPVVAGMMFADVLTKFGQVHSDVTPRPTEPTSKSEECGFSTNGVISLALTQVTAESLALETGKYTAILVGLIDGERVPMITASTTVSTADKDISVEVKIAGKTFSPRLTGVEVYLRYPDNLAPDYDGSKFYLYAIDGESNGIMTVFSDRWDNDASGTHWTYAYNTFGQALLDQYQATSPTLLANIARSYTIESRIRYKFQEYLNGRIYAANTSDDDDHVRFSFIRGISQQLSIFPFSEADGYGYIPVNEGTSDVVTGLMSTPDNDLMIFKSKGAYIYEVQSGSSGLRRLRQVFNGIGVPIGFRHTIRKSPYGIFFANNSDIYLYTGGYALPRRLGIGKIRSQWSSWMNNSAEIISSVFDHESNEYWIMLVYGSTYALIYSVASDSWTMIQLSSSDVRITNDGNNSISLMNSTSGIRTISRNAQTNFLTTTTATTGKIHLAPPDGSAMLYGIQLKYESGSATGVKIDVYVDDEPSVRNGMTVTFPATTIFANKYRPLRNAVSCKSVRVSISNSVPGIPIAYIDSIGIDHDLVQSKSERAY